MVTNHHPPKHAVACRWPACACVRVFATVDMVHTRVWGCVFVTKDACVKEMLKPWLRRDETMKKGNSVEHLLPLPNLLPVRGSIAGLRCLRAPNLRRCNNKYVKQMAAKGERRCGSVRL